MDETHGSFIWIELMTSDVEGAARFYGDVVGWSSKPVDGIDYTVFEAGVPGEGCSAGVAGLMTLPASLAAEGVPPNWTGYVAVSDCDATAARAEELGGTVCKGPEDIPGIGRFAVIADPHGAVICIMTPKPMETTPPTVPMMAPGQLGWSELHAGDCDEAFAFYADLFGWTKESDMDMGPMGIYRIFAHQGRAIGGMMTRLPQVPMPHWAYYVAVPALDAAVDRIGLNGGTVIFGPQEVPGPAYIVNAVDPQGAHFNLVSTVR
ncbi:VOC family protein [Rhizobium sp. YIM 134829]|uniref:VOC family protein n=1 Tax=Rhizobium sp. YIM 134829 TaxID=3390453 RepID=UPI00397E8D67